MTNQPNRRALVAALEAARADLAAVRLAHRQAWRHERATMPDRFHVIDRRCSAAIDTLTDVIEATREHKETDR